MAKATYTGKLTDFGEVPFPDDVPKLWVAPKRGAFGAVGVLATRRVAITVAPNGSFSVDLVPSAALMPPQSYLLRCEWSGGGSTEWEFTALRGGGNIKDMAVIDSVGLYREAVGEILPPLIQDEFAAQLPVALDDYDLLFQSELGAVRTLMVEDPLYSEVRLSFDFRRIGGTLRGGGEVGVNVGSAESALPSGSGVVLLTRDYRRARADTANGWPLPGDMESSDFTAFTSFGDSMTTDHGSIGVTVTAELARELGVSGYDAGVSGDTPFQIVWRMGGIPVTVSLGASVGTLPASGQIPVTVEPLQGWSASSRAWPCVIHDVNGGAVQVTLRQEAASPNTTPTWTLEQSGASPAARQIFSNTRIAHTESLNREIQQAPVILWMGRNDLDMVRGEVAIKGALAALRDTCQRLLVRPVFNRSTGPAGSPAYAAAMAYNDMLLEHVGPARWLDSRRMLIDHGLEAAGITPTPADLTAISEDRIPDSLMSDLTHLNAAGRRAQARLDAIEIKARNW